MTQLELTLIILVLLTSTWTVLITLWARKIAKEYEDEIMRYQEQSTQIKIAQHVIRNKFFRDGGEVFR